MADNSITQMNKKTAQLKVKNDVTHEFHLKFHEQMKKKSEVIVTSKGRNKNLDEIKT